LLGLDPNIHSLWTLGSSPREKRIVVAKKKAGITPGLFVFLFALRGTSHHPREGEGEKG